jgi:tetratricopeptide (TPR) repeat protein
MRRKWSRQLAVPALSLLLAVAIAPASAQSWRGEGRARGVVEDLPGHPLGGARVTLLPGEEPPGEGVPDRGPEPQVTGVDGRWSAPLLAPGIWRIRVEADGYLPADGRIVVTEEGVGDEVRVRLRGLDEVSATFAESDPARSVRQWLEKGDVFLAQGRPGDARGEYEKALRNPEVLAPSERAQVLETVARTHFLEGDRAGAERALRAALVVAPEQERLRQLYTALLEPEQRSAEAAAFLGRLDREPEAVRAELAEGLAGLLEPEPEAEPAPSPLPERPLLAPEAGRRGRYRTSFHEGAPLSDPAVVLARTGTSPSEVRQYDPSEGRYDLAEETFEVYVPQDYRAGAGYGLLVWVSPVVTGGPSPELEAVLDAHHLLWVGANRAGNPRFTWNRIGLALDAAHAMAGLYDLDPDRVYAAGYSGGGRIASTLGLLFPETFHGAFCLYGVSYFRPVGVPDRPGAHWPPAFPEPPRKTMGTVRRDSRFVILSGTRDFNRAQSILYSEAMREDGIGHVTYLEIPEASHYTRVPPQWWTRALEALDGP